jgi:hypothetical protein
MAVGVALLVAGVVLLVASSVPLPYVEVTPREEMRITATPGLATVNRVLLDETFVLDASPLPPRPPSTGPRLRDGR